MQDEGYDSKQKQQVYQAARDVVHNEAADPSDQQNHEHNRPNAHGSSS
jgi:hypothetical protein